MSRFTLVVAASSVIITAAGVPKGHLEPFGGWKEGPPVEERDDIPEPKEFYDKYCTSDRGYGKPVIFRGAARSMPAMAWASDAVLLERYGKEKISGVEWDLKETRAGGKVNGMNVMKDFLNAYNTTDIYMVSEVPKKMKKDVKFLPCMTCGGFLQYLDTNNLWVGRGGSKSVIHYDDQDNINCLFDGKKRFIMIHPKYKKRFEANPNTKKNKFGWVDTDLDQSIPGYGAFFQLDVDKMDLIKYPGWSDIDWSYADLEPGDCIYIPYQWYHQVTAAPVRSINAHIWFWRPSKFDEASCAKKEHELSPSLADCTWNFEPNSGHIGKPTDKKKKTRCRKAQESPRGEL